VQNKTYIDPHLQQGCSVLMGLLAHIDPQLRPSN